VSPVVSHLFQLLYHAPLLLHSNTDTQVAKRFRFESIWPKFPGYLDAVREGWRCTLQNADACRILDFKLRNMAKELKRWSQEFVGSIRFQQVVANEVIFKLEHVQDTNPSGSVTVTSQRAHGQMSWPCFASENYNTTVISVHVLERR
jgi:hypothetical protein